MWTLVSLETMSGASTIGSHLSDGVGSINYFCKCIGLDWGVLQMCDAARYATVRGMRAMRGMRGVRGVRGIKVMILKKTEINGNNQGPDGSAMTNENKLIDVTALLDRHCSSFTLEKIN